MKAICGLLIGFGAVLAVTIGGRMGADSDAMTVILGVFTGFVLIVVAVLVFGALHRVNENMTRRNISSIRVQATQAGGSGLVLDRGAYLPTHTNTRPVTRRNEAWGQSTGAGQYRNFAYEVPTKTRRYRRNLLGDAAAGAPIVETLTPNREMNLRSDVGVPIGQSLFSGLVAALVAAFVSWKLGGDVLSWTIAGFVMGMAVCWLAALGLARQLVWKIERFVGDLDGDGYEGEPPEESHTLLVQPGEARSEAGKVAREHAGAIKTAELLSFLTRCATVGTSEGKLGIGTSPQQRAKYAALRDTLIQLGIGAWKDENRRALGWVLTMTPEQAAPIISRHVKELRNST